MKRSVEVCNESAEAFMFGYPSEDEQSMQLPPRQYFNEMLKLLFDELSRENESRRIHSITIFLMRISVLCNGLADLTPYAYGQIAELLRNADSGLDAIGHGRRNTVMIVPEERRSSVSGKASLLPGEREVIAAAINLTNPMEHAQRLRELIHALASHGTTSFVITVDIGVASTSITNKRSLSEVLHEADGALRAARWKGTLLPGDDDMLFGKDTLAFLV